MKGLSLFSGIGGLDLAAGRVSGSEMLRVIREIRPRWLLAENVRGAINLALDTVVSGLEDEGSRQCSSSSAGVSLVWGNCADGTND